MKRTRPYLAAVAFLASLACGGDGNTGPAASRNSPGTGSSSMLVKADIDANDVSGGFSTDYEVSLRDALGNAISGAAVTIQNPVTGTLMLAETGVGSGIYFQTRAGFPSGDFRLDVTRGTDNVRGVILGGPGVHNITSPGDGSAAAAGQPLNIAWTVPSRAVAAEVETNSFGPVVIADLGGYTLAGANNPVDPSQSIEVRRYNEVGIGGGLAGSRLRVTVQNTAEPVNVQ